ncbi:MAG: winged helix-turn-helix transcriptional regulator [Candidatus Lokiarchaeota archaeon]|nr:winged helix-turn-helix transcriptional regulator [Candidatus Lokiarchaeota archaeon]
MDEIDLQIAKILLKNCRTPYRKIADELNLSLNAIYKRIKNMIEKGIIQTFTARPSLIALNGIEVLIYGKTIGKDTSSISQELGESENIYFVGVAGGNILYIHGYLHDISELNDYIIFVSKIGKLENIISLIKKYPQRINPVKLIELDFRILNSLKVDGKKSTKDISEEIQVSSKTIQKYIKKMIEYDLVEFSINFAPQTQTSQFHIYLHRESDYNQEFKRLEEKYRNNILYIQQYSNVPNLIMMTALTRTNDEAANLYAKLQKEGFKEILHNLFINGFFFSTWRECNTN